MRVLVACEFSGAVRDAFTRKGHEAWSCDILDSETPGHHLQGCALKAIEHALGWDMLIAHPPCTYLCSSGLHWNTRRPGRAEQTESALKFVEALMASDIPKICIENPIGCISTRIRKPDQIIQPYQFGHDAAKATCLWLKNLVPLEPTIYVQPRIVGGKKRWANQCDSGQNKLGPSESRAAEERPYLLGNCRSNGESVGIGFDSCDRAVLISIDRSWNYQCSLHETRSAFPDRICCAGFVIW